MTRLRPLELAHPRCLTSALLGDPPKIRRIAANSRRQRRRQDKSRACLVIADSRRASYMAKITQNGGRIARNGLSLRKVMDGGAYTVCLPPSRAPYFSVQFVCSRRLFGKPPNCQISSTIPPFEKRACFVYQNVSQRLTPFAKLSKLSMTASLPLIWLSQIKQTPLSSLASYYQGQDGTKTDTSCSVGSFDPTGRRVSTGSV